MNAPTYWLGKRLRTYLGRINPRQSLSDRTAARCTAFVCDADAPRYRAGRTITKYVDAKATAWTHNPLVAGWSPARFWVWHTGSRTAPSYDGRWSLMTASVSTSMAANLCASANPNPYRAASAPGEV